MSYSCGDILSKISIDGNAALLQIKNPLEVALPIGIFSSNFLHRPIRPCLLKYDEDINVVQLQEKHGATDAPNNLEGLFESPKMTLSKGVNALHPY